MDTSQFHQALTTIEINLNRLSQGEPLPVDQALGLAEKVAEMVEQVAAPSIESGDLRRAADLYDTAARAYHLAAAHVSRTDRRRLISLRDFWSTQANLIRHETPPDPSAPEHPPTSLITDATNESPVAYEKHRGPQEEPRTGGQSRSSVGKPKLWDSTTLADRRKPGFSRKKPGP
jgi:hypothetical protein